MNEAALTAVSEDMKRSTENVNGAIKPIVEKLLSGWKLMQVEGKDDEVCKLLDMSCGVDYLLHSEKSGVILGLSSRVQYEENYRTFTVRKERESGALTEYEKRTQAMTSGGIYPYYTIQAYMKDGEVKGLGITKTSDLIEYIKKGYADEKETGMNRIGQAKFYVCHWDDMKIKGYKVIEYKERQDKTIDNDE